MKNNNKLTQLSKDSNYAIELGKAAEYIVCADIILHGLRCFPSNQGLPYDLVIDKNGQLIRVQVKSTCFPKNVNVLGRRERLAYSYHIRRRGKKGSSELSSKDCDIVALVALDTRTIAYVHIAEAAQTIQLLPNGVERPTGAYRRWESFSDLTLDRVMEMQNVKDKKWPVQGLPTERLRFYSR